MPARQQTGTVASRLNYIRMDRSVRDALNMLQNPGVDALVVIDGAPLTDGAIVGIITERDILRASAATRGPLEFLSVRERMTRCPVVAAPQHEVSDVMCVMTERRIRHVPVVEGGSLIGIISIGDTVKAQHDELCRENHYLKSYIQS